MAIMECNKDEAIRAKEVAERKFAERDYYGARKFALKAQKLYPDLDGLTQMLKTFDVYIFAHTKTSSGEVDWYGVLGVQPWEDDDTVRKQYHTLALMLHPGKNKSVGADGAFKLVSDAWTLLSDRAKRLAYDEKLNVLQQRVSIKNRSESTRPAENGFHYDNSAGISSRPQNKSTRTRPTSVPSSNRPNTFWTICNHCKTQYEYMRVYLNQTLLCPNCNEAFFAMERAPPPNIAKATNFSLQQKYSNSGHHSARSSSSNVGRNWADFTNNGQNLQWNHVSGMVGAGATGSSSSNVPQTVSAGQQAHAQVDTQWDQGRGVSERERGYISNRMHNSSLEDRVIKRISTYYGSPDANHTASAGFSSGSTGNGYGEAERSYGFSGVNNRSITTRELSLTDIRNLLLTKAYKDICKQLQEWRSNPLNLQGNKRQRKMNDDPVVTNGKNHKSFPRSSDDVDKQTIEHMSIIVPDSDFHNFDLDRTEASFRDDQVWAAYDENDGMPRYYARIQKVISLKPFKMKISWLNSRSSNEFGSLDWVGCGFTKTCGEFRTGRHEISNRLNSFSHMVKWSKGARGMVCILPRKGDVWALYRNWSSDWNTDTPEEVVRQYDMVEILDDYTEELGISIIPLIKVAGFKTVFRKHIDLEKVRRIPREEMFRFSHHVPDHVLTGEEAENAPKGCRELDPAAMSLELLQVISKADEEQAPMQIDGKAEEGLGPSGGGE